MKVHPQEVARRSGVAVHIVTAYNPMARHASDDANEHADAALAAWLVERDLEHHRAIGRSPDGRWEEPGFVVVGLDIIEAIEIGRTFEQLAIYEVTATSVTVHYCDRQRSFQVATEPDR